MDVFAWVDWQGARAPAAGGKVVRLAPRSAAPATINRQGRRGAGVLRVPGDGREPGSNPVPAPRRGQGLRPTARGMLGHLGPGRARGGGRLVREQRRLPESLDLADVQAFMSGLRTHRDRAMVLAMLLGGLRSAEVRGLLLKARSTRDDGGCGWSARADGNGWSRSTRRSSPSWPPTCATSDHAGSATPECFVVLRGTTTGAPVSEAGLRALFRRHRGRLGSDRVRSHRLRHTFGTELATAGIDLLALRELMGHASPETTSRYEHLSVEHLAAEYAAARVTMTGTR